MKVTPGAIPALDVPVLEGVVPIPAVPISFVYPSGNPTPFPIPGGPTWRARAREEDAERVRKGKGKVIEESEGMGFDDPIERIQRRIWRRTQSL